MQCVIKRSQQGTDIWDGATQICPPACQPMCEGREGSMGLGHSYSCKALYVRYPLVGFWFYLSCNILLGAYGRTKIGSSIRCHTHPCVDEDGNSIIVGSFLGDCGKI